MRVLENHELEHITGAVDQAPKPAPAPVTPVGILGVGIASANLISNIFNSVNNAISSLFKF